jgi:hypothetical protein
MQRDTVSKYFMALKMVYNNNSTTHFMVDTLVGYSEILKKYKLKNNEELLPQR